MPEIGQIVWAVVLLGILFVAFNEEGEKRARHINILQQREVQVQSAAHRMSSGPSDIAEYVPDQNAALSIVVFGASGDLASRKIFPTLFALYNRGVLPSHTTIIGYARSQLSRAEFEEKVSKNFKLHASRDPSDFLSMCHYIQGSYDSKDDLESLHHTLLHHETLDPTKKALRLFYFAVSPSVFVPLAHQLKASCMAPKPGQTRIVVEKPFGKDMTTCCELLDALAIFSDDQVFKIDHYLGKPMVQNLLVLRFANSIFESLWTNKHIANVVVTFKEDIGLEGRGAYFDEYGIIRDVMQNHLVQILSLIGMEAPSSLEPELIKEQKLAFLKSIRDLDHSDVAVGQFGKSSTGWREKGYLENDNVKESSRTPTYAAAALFVDNDRWRDVPFILRCGKGLDERKVEISIQFKPVMSPMFRAEQEVPNELVIRVQPDESISMNLITKHPGLTGELVESEIDFSYKSKYVNVAIPDAYERLILDVIEGDKSLFLQDEELKEAWRIFTPVLHHLEKNISPEIYPFGSSGPENANQLVNKYGFKRVGRASR